MAMESIKEAEANSLYKDVEINNDRVSNAAEDDTELWEALSAEHCPPPPSSPTTTITMSSQSTNGEHLHMHVCGCKYLLAVTWQQTLKRSSYATYLFTVYS